ncbi:hypothetical protein J6590_003194 [Homalodisca vitripennis]|nr:hypothetical protein J6590_003194 [Homalodisca vitripennis]
MDLEEMGSEEKERFTWLRLLQEAPINIFNGRLESDRPTFRKGGCGSYSDILGMTHYGLET